MINRMVEITQLGNLHSATLLYVVKLQLSVIAFSPQTCFCPLRFSMYRIIIRDMGDKWLHGGLRISLMGSGRPSCGAYWLNLGTFQYFLCFPPPKKELKFLCFKSLGFHAQKNLIRFILIFSQTVKFASLFNLIFH